MKTTAPTGAAVGHIAPIQNRQSKIQNAFTLVEMLIVIGLIMLIMMLAVPTLRALTGSASTNAAANQLSSYIGQARMTAIGLQQITGVLFFIEKDTDRLAACLVTEAIPNSGGSIVYLDRVANRDYMLLPPGIGLQTIENATLDGSGQRIDNGYIIPDPLQGLPDARIGSAILFDSNGRLMNRNFGFQLVLNGTATDMARTIYYPTNPPNGAATVTHTGAALVSAVGFVLYEREPHVTAYGKAYADQLPDPAPGTTNTTYTGSGRVEERWLDENAVPYLVNRYNGTLIKGE